MMTRREFFKCVLAGGCGASIPLFCEDEVWAAPYRAACSGKLSFYNLHTHESVSVRYLRRNGSLDPRALRKLDWLFRCHYTGTVRRIDRRLYMLLDAIRNRLGSNHKPYLLVSGYRSPAYNAYLRRTGHRVAKRSFHLKGMAADIFLENVPLRAIRNVAAGLRAGGVGAYSDFIHVDVGPVRYW